MPRFICSLALLLVLTWTTGQDAHAQDTHLYIVDVGPNRGAPWQVLRAEADGSNPVVFIDTELNRPQDIVFLDHRGTAIVSNLATQKITEYDAETGEYLGDFATGIGQPTRMEIGADGLLYVLQWAGNGKVLRYDLDGNFVDEFTQTGVSNAIGMDWDADGNLYVASFDDTTVRKYGPDGQDMGLFVDPTEGLFGPTNIWFTDNGDLWVMDWSGGAIRRYNAAGVLQGNPVLGLSEPEGVEFLDNGEFIIGNGGTASVRRYDATGQRLADFVPPGAGGLAKPNGLRFHSPSTFTLNAGLNDAWFNTATIGQGVFINVFPVLGKVFLAMFTFDTQQPPEDAVAVVGWAGHRWVTALGDFSGNTAVLSAELTEGGLFNSAEPKVQQTPGYGTFTLVFTDCSNAVLTYEFPGLGLSGSIELTRVVNDNVALCEQLND